MNQTTTSSNFTEIFPVEIIREILVWTVDHYVQGYPRTVCLLSKKLCEVAFDTPELWQRLTTKCTLHRTDGQVLVNAEYFEFIARWHQRLGNLNQFSLHFRLYDRRIPVCSNALQGLVPFDISKIKMLFKFFGRARYFKMNQHCISSLEHIIEHSGHIAVIERLSFPFLESLKIDERSIGGPFTDTLQAMLGTYAMPAIRKISIHQNNLSQTLPLPSLSNRIQNAYLATWKHLTHIQAHFVTTLLTWRTLIGQCDCVESACLTLQLRLDDNVGVVSHTIYTLANLKELYLVLDCNGTNFRVDALFDHVALPALQTFQLRDTHLTFDGLHQLLIATPLLERLRLQCTFPSIYVQSAYDLRGTHVIQFPTATAKRLADHAAHLKHIIIDIPKITQFSQSFRPYIDGMRQSGWLNKPWQDGPPRFDFYLRDDITYDKDRKLMVDDLYQYLSENNSGGKESGVELCLRKWNTSICSKMTMSSDSQLWHSMLLDMGLEFQEADLYM